FGSRQFSGLFCVFRYDGGVKNIAAHCHGAAEPRHVILRPGGDARESWGRLALSHELVDAAFRGQSGVDVAARVDADAVVMAAVEADEHISLSIADADLRRLAAVFLLGDVEIAVLAAGDVVRPAHAGPHAEEVAVRRED